MPDRLPPLPLESRDFSDRPRGALFRISGVSAVAQVGLCLSVLGVPIYAALMIAPAKVMEPYEKATGGFGFAAMAALAAISVALLKKRPWSRKAMLAFSLTLLVWECLKLPIALFWYAPVLKQALVQARDRQMAAATQPTSQPAYFESFTSFGVYLLRIVGA
jgi:hypothetical protein